MYVFKNRWVRPVIWGGFVLHVERASLTGSVHYAIITLSKCRLWFWEFVTKDGILLASYITIVAVGPSGREAPLRLHLCTRNITPTAGSCETGALVYGN